MIFIYLIKYIDNNKGGHVIITTESIMPPSNTEENEIVSWILDNALWIVLSGILGFCLSCCVVMLTCCHYKIHRGKRSKISHQIQIERVKTQSPYPTNDDIFHLEYDHEYDGKSNGTHKYSNTNIEDMDDEDSNDSLSFNIDNENDDDFTNPIQSKPKLGNVPSQSSVLHFEYTNSVSIGLMHQSQNDSNPTNDSNLTNDNDHNLLSIEQHKMGNLSEGNDDDSDEIGENSRNNKGYSFLSDDDGSVEEMYNHHKKVTLGGIDENYDQETEIEKTDINVTNGEDKNKEENEGLNNNQLYVGLPKEEQTQTMNTRTTTTTTTTTESNGYNGIDATTDFDKYPSLPPELSEDARSRAN